MTIDPTLAFDQLSQRLTIVSKRVEEARKYFRIGNSDALSSCLVDIDSQLRSMKIMLEEIQPPSERPVWLTGQEEVDHG